MAKYYIGVISLILAGQLVLFTNCSETDFSNDSLTSLQNLSNEEDFFLWLDRYKQRAAELREVNTLESNVLAEELETNIAKLEGLIDPQGSNLPHHDNVVLGVRDYLDASYADGGDLILRINFDDEINKLKQKDIELEGKIAALEGRLKDDLASVKADLEQQIQAGDAENLSYIQSQLATVNAQISSLEAADQDIFRQIAAMRIDIDANKAEIAANTELITQLNVALNEAIQNNQQELIAKINEEKSALLVLITNLENENNTLSQQYTTLSNQHSELAANFITFKMEVEARFARIEDRISSLESRVGVLDETILVIDNRISVVNQNVEDLQSSTASSLQNLKESIEGVKTDTEAQILALQQLNVELKQQISDQEDAFKELMESQREVADLQGKMCTANDSRTKCTGNESDLDSNCCLALDTLNCEVLFADPSQVSARSQATASHQRGG